MIDTAHLLQEIADVIVLLLSAFAAFVYRKVIKMEEDIINRMTIDQVDRRIDEKLALLYHDLQYIKARLDTITEIRVKHEKN